MIDGFTEKHALFSESTKHESPYAAAVDKWLSINEQFVSLPLVTPFIKHSLKSVLISIFPHPSFLFFK
jgi:hypothetical protein